MMFATEVPPPFSPPQSTPLHCLPTHFHLHLLTLQLKIFHHFRSSNPHTIPSVPFSQSQQHLPQHISQTVSKIKFFQEAQARFKQWDLVQALLNLLVSKDLSLVVATGQVETLSFTIILDVGGYLDLFIAELEDILHESRQFRGQESIFLGDSQQLGEFRQDSEHKNVVLLVDIVCLLVLQCFLLDVSSFLPFDEHQFLAEQSLGYMFPRVICGFMKYISFSESLLLIFLKLYMFNQMWIQKYLANKGPHSVLVEDLGKNLLGKPVRILDNDGLPILRPTDNLGMRTSLGYPTSTSSNRNTLRMKSGIDSWIKVYSNRESRLKLMGWRLILQMISIRFPFQCRIRTMMIQGSARHPGEP